MSAMLKFATFTSDIELPFYNSLANLKINHDKLDDSSRQILGLYEIHPTDAPEVSCRLQIHGNSLTSDAYGGRTSYVGFIANSVLAGSRLASIVQRV